MSKDGFVKIYPSGRGLNSVVYRGEREDGTAVAGCRQIANASSTASRFGALKDVSACMIASGEFDNVIPPSRDEP